MNYLDYLMLGSAALGALVGFATVLAPLTKNTLDDKAVGLLGMLKKAVDALAISFKK